jgi:6-phosphogluconolactonase/glucosamine-6-phosphate isomerase/deaminase
MATVTVAANGEALAAAAAARLTDQLASEGAGGTQLVLGLTGGHTPKRLYELLADPARPFRARIP